MSGNIGPVLSGSSAGTVSGVDATLNAAKRAELMYPNLFSRLEEGKPDSKFLSQSGRGTLGVDAQRLLWYWATKLGCTQSKGALNE